jgi:hypothetical protein
LDPELGFSKSIAAPKKPKRNSDTSREPQYTNPSKKAKAQISNRDLSLAHRNSKNKQGFVNRQPYSSNFVKSKFIADQHGQQEDIESFTTGGKRFYSKKVTESSQPSNLSHKQKAFDVDSGVGFGMSQTQPVTSKESSKVPCVDLTENLIKSVKGKSGPSLARQQSEKHYGKSITNLSQKNYDKLCPSPNIIHEKDSNVSIADSNPVQWIRKTMSKFA